MAASKQQIDSSRSHPDRVEGVSSSLSVRSGIGSGTKSEAKTEAILAGARQEFLENGYKGTSVDRLAKAAGVSKPTLYSHFKDKEDLFEAVVLQQIQHFQNDIAVLPIELSLDDDPKTMMRSIFSAMLTRMLNNADQHQDLIRLMIGESGRFPHLAQEMARSVHKPILEKLTQVLALHPEIECLDPEMTAASMMGSLLYYGMTQNILQASEILPLDRERYLIQLAEMAVGY